MNASGAAYLVALLCLIAGVMLSVATSNWTWLSRSGSLIVVTGVMQTSSQIVTSLDLLRHDRHQRGSNHDWADETRTRSWMRRRSADDNDSDSERSGFYLIIVGTLVWGFGDLLGGVAG